MADSGTTAFSNAKFDPTVILQGHKPLYLNESAAEYNVTNLNNGFTVLTESSTFPGAVNMGKCFCQPAKLRVAPFLSETACAVLWRAVLINIIIG